MNEVELHQAGLTDKAGEFKLSLVQRGPLELLPAEKYPEGEGNSNPFQYSWLENSMDRRG